jgi:hypothetical protein
LRIYAGNAFVGPADWNGSVGPLVAKLAALRAAAEKSRVNLVAVALPIPELEPITIAMPPIGHVAYFDLVCFFRSNAPQA